MPRISKVGDGWGGTEDYATLVLWQAAEGAVDYGAPIEAQCSGFIGNDVNLNHTNPNGSLVYGVTQFDGSNQSSLAYGARLKNNGVNIKVSHLKLTNTFSWDWALDCNGTGGGDVSYCYIEDTSGSTGVYGAVSVYGTGDGIVHHCVVNTNSQIAFRTGYDRPLNIYNNTIFGATGTAISGSSANKILKDNFFFNCATSISGWFDILLNNATQDSSGQLTGYTSAELVDFAGSNYQLKSTSTLATASSTGSFVGAFIETSSGLTISPNSILTNEAFGTTEIKRELILFPSAIISSEILGNPNILVGSVYISPTGTLSGENLGIPKLSYSLYINTAGIASQELLGFPLISDGGSFIIPNNRRATYQELSSYLASTGQFINKENHNDLIFEWLRYENMSDGTIPDLFDSYLNSLGGMGNLSDKINQWRRGEI